MTTGLDGTVYVIGGYAQNYWATPEVDAYTPVAPVTPTLTVTDAGGVYNGTPYVATATTSPTGLSVTFDYQQEGQNGPIPNGAWTDLGPNAPTNVGFYSVTANFAGTADYSAASSSTVDFNIPPATATILVTPTPGLIYNGGPQVTATGTATGVGGVNLSSDLTINSTHTNAEIYPDTWSFTDPTGNYASETGTMTDTIGQATAWIRVTPRAGPVSILYPPGVLAPQFAVSAPVYNGGPQATAWGMAWGVSTAGYVVLPSTDLTINSTHTNAGNYLDTWSFTDPTGNYAPEHSTVVDTIGQATATILVTPTPGLIYNGGPQVTATGTATGVGGVNLSSDLTINSTHTNAEIYPDTWSFTDPTGNYASETGTMTDTIGQATATILVTPTPGLIYNGGPQVTATGTATGVGGVNLSSDLTINSTHTNAEIYPDTWSFTDPTGNYASETGTMTDTIGQATAWIRVTPRAGPVSILYPPGVLAPQFAVSAPVYNGGPQATAWGMAWGVSTTGYVVLPSTDLTINSTHTNAGNYLDTWSFTDPTGNYAPEHSTVVDTIGQASLTITANNTTKVYGTTATLSYIAGGLVNNNTVTSVIETSAGAVSTANVGSYPILISDAVGTGLNNYSITYVDGTLKVTTNPPIAFITTLYQEILGRAPDAAGLTSWVNAVNSGATVAQIANSFWNSPEHLAHPIGNLNTATHDADNAFVSVLYQDILGRTGDTGGIASWDQVLDSNSATPNQVAMDFWNSSEHQAKLKAGTAPASTYSISVTALYNELLGRSPDTSGLNVWVNIQYSGALTMNQMVQGFANSAESVTRTSQ